MIPLSNTILQIFSKPKAAAVTKQMKVITSELSASRDGEAALLLYASKKQESSNFHQLF